MWYLVKKEGQYFKPNSYVNSSGLCDDFTWVPSVASAWTTSSMDLAKAVAGYSGGTFVKYD